MNQPPFKQYQQVICNGYPGTIKRQYSEGMYEVRLNSGLVCVDKSAIKPITCVWCGCSPDSTKPCNAPDGDGHLFNYGIQK